jgi:glycosyltransferase involved in cell wall biosynthesis
MADGSQVMPKYSIVIPAYNEAKRLGSSLERVGNYVIAQGWDAEVIVVNDGSSDATPDLVRECARRYPFLRLLENPGNRGKGYSVRNGMLHASGDLLLFSDADLSAPIEEAPKLLSAIKNGADIAIGSRWIRPETQTKRQKLMRQFYGRAFNGALRILLRLKQKDTQCGFKAFTREAAQKVFPLQRIERWGFDPEILYLGRHFGFRIDEVPVAWADVGGTRINPLRDGLRMIGEVLRVRWNALSGKYRVR